MNTHARTTYSRVCSPGQEDPVPAPVQYIAVSHERDPNVHSKPMFTPHLPLTRRAGLHAMGYCWHWGAWGRPGICVCIHRYGSGYYRLVCSDHISRRVYSQPSYLAPGSENKQRSVCGCAGGHAVVTRWRGATRVDEGRRGRRGKEP